VTVDKAIVCGVDGSADSQAALFLAARMADQLGARLVLANAVEYAQSPYAVAGAFGPAAARAPVTATPDDPVQAGEQLLETMVEEAGVEPAERRVIAGFAAEGLVDLADEQDAELIVVGSRGRGAFKSPSFGSVSASLIGVARCPVVVVSAGA
jgi:nucleotide-binding universal stress UspA family protein